MLRALLASLLLTALYARALTGAERRAPLRAKRTKRPPSSSAGAKTRTRYVDDPGFVGDGYFEAVEVHRREPPRAARAPALDLGDAARPGYGADPLSVYAGAVRNPPGTRPRGLFFFGSVSRPTGPGSTVPLLCNA